MANKKTVTTSAEKVRKRNSMVIAIRLALVALLALLIILYTVLHLAYGPGNFTVTLDQAAAKEMHLILYENKEERKPRFTLEATPIEFVTNISVDWLPKNIDNEGDGNHNGANYLAYTFYVENKGVDVCNYWYKIPVDDVIKNVDEAIRVMIFKNGEKTIYAKLNGKTNQPESETTAFYESDVAVLEKREAIQPEEVDKFTVVIWLEGDDPDCIDDLLGGEIKMHMEITEEHIQ